MFRRKVQSTDRSGNISRTFNNSGIFAVHYSTPHLQNTFSTVNFKYSTVVVDFKYNTLQVLYI